MFSKGLSAIGGSSLIAAAALAAVAAVALPSTAQANLITNGNFAANAAAYVSSPGYSGAPNPAAPTDWTISSNAAGVNGPDTGFYTAQGAPFAPASTTGVNDFLFMQNRATNVSQTVATTAGQSYTLTFDAAQRDTNTTAALQAIITDATDGSTITALTPAVTDTAFAQYSLNFTATSGSTNVEFINISPANVDNTVDVSNVSMAVPEPAAYGLVGVGALGLLFLKPRRRLGVR